MGAEVREEIAEQFKCVVEGLDIGYLVIDEHAHICDVNRAYCELLGYSEEELLGSGFYQYCVNLSKSEEQALLTSWMQKEGTTAEMSHKTKGSEVREVELNVVPVTQSAGTNYVSLWARDITDQKKAKRRIRESEERWKQLVSENPQPIQITQDAVITFINKAGVELYGGRSKEDLIGRSVYDFSDPERIQEIENRKKRLENGQPVDEVFEHKINCLDGEERYVHIYSIPTVYEDKPTIQSVIYDVTDQKRKEHRIKSSLDEKETLLKEIHHRVKNNLAIISGLLELQVLNTEDQSTIGILRDSQQRIKSMAMIHEKLYESEALADIGFDRHLRELVESISQTYSTDEYDVDINYDLDSASLEIEQAIPCSLIVNEMVVNCYKHAFTTEAQGTIRLSSKYEEPKLTITIQDDGRGLPEDFDFDNQNTLGMSLIQTLTGQLNGDVQFTSLGKNQGTKFELSFNVK